jgi:hypothetical protein
LAQGDATELLPNLSLKGRRTDVKGKFERRHLPRQMADDEFKPRLQGVAVVADGRRGKLSVEFPE